MKYLGILIPIFLILGIVWYIFPDTGYDSNNWKIVKELESPNNETKAIVKSLNSVGATVGFYTKIYLLSSNGNPCEMMRVRTDKLDIKWITNNILEVSVGGKTTKIYDFTSVFWNENSKSEYFISLKYN